MESVDPNSITSLSIHNSPLLSICDLQNICDYLSDPSNTAYISGNATGCASVGQVQLVCGLPVSCPNGITFTNQTQIDAYPINYPGCSTISGNVFINGSNITNLDGLAEVTAIEGSLNIYSNPSLIDLTGLSALTSIGGILYVDNNDALTSLEGLENIDPNSITYLSIYSSTVLSICDVQSICDYLSDPSNTAYVSGNATGCASIGQIQLACGLPVSCPTDIYFSSQSQIDAFPVNYPGCITVSGKMTINGNNITNLSGLAQITSIGGDLVISYNSSLASLSGLDALTTVGGYLGLQNNASLVDLSALENLVSIGGNLNIYNNAALTSLEGLENIDPNTISDLIIQSSNALSICNVQSICDYLSDPSNYAFISGNATGCASVGQVKLACGLPIQCPVDISFYTQAQIDAFPINYPGCSTISGNVSINGSNITNLDGLAEVTTIGGSLSIYNNPSLTYMSGLSALTSIGGNLNIQSNSALIGLEGLNSLNSIGIYLNISDNTVLTDLAGLISLTSIGGGLYVQNNAALTSLSGLDNIDPNTITTLYITSSNELATCNVQSICDYLSDPSNYAFISGNATGCASVGQVKLACGLPIQCPIDISFYTQAQIDAFPLNYPGCTTITGNMVINGPDIFDLNAFLQITTIEGGLTIGGNNVLTNLEGLSSLTSIGIYLNISNNPVLTDLTALSSLISIGGGLYVQNNAALTNLTGLDNIDPNTITTLYITSSNELTTCNVQSICDYLSEPSNTAYISGNATGCASIGQVELACGLPVTCPEGISFYNQSQIDAFPINYPGCNTITGYLEIQGADITNLDGLAQITSIEGNLNIGNNPILTSLTGLSALTSIGGNLHISSNGSLTSLAGLESVTSIGGGINVFYNDALISLSGLDNIDPSSITNLNIQSSNLLSTCDVPSICEYLANSSNPATIFGNATGCASINQVKMACGLPVSCPNGITFTNQAQIDAYPINYPGCSTISGNVSINGSNITNLDGLAEVTTIEGGLYIYSNPSLTDLSGLSALTSIGGTLYIDNNDALTSLEGLNNVTLIGTSLIINDNTVLTDLTGLNSLTSIGGGLYVQNNPALTNLAGLDNIDPNTITILYITSSNELATCNVESICDFLSDPSNSASISGNATGCASIGQVELACGLPVTCPGDIIFSNQAQIDAFPINYPGCTTFTGNVGISGLDISNLDGLAQITSIEGSLTIGSNPALTSLVGLNALTSIQGYLNMYDNDILTSLSGLDNIDPNTITNIIINSSNSLSTCNVQSICDYLSDPSNTVYISGNATGCASVPEVQVACGLPGTCTGNYYFYSQADIDAFPVNYPYCDIITGSVLIQGADITNLNGLSQISSIQGNLSILWNEVLTSLTGLNALATIGGDLHMVVNNLLTDFSGLESLSSIGGYFYVNSNSSLVNFSGLGSLSSIGGYFDILNSPSLTNLSGLNALTSIGGYLRIFSNNSLSDLTGLGSVTSIGGELNIINNSNLTSLSGLDNINSSTITNLIIENSNELYLCNIPSICGYLSEPSNTATIIGNALGCANITEVVSICDGCFPEQIISHPQDQCASNGTTVSFSVEVEGTPPFSYQWYENSTLVPGETSASFTINPVTFASNGNTYYCEVSNCLGTFSSTSNTATLRVFGISCPSNISVNNDIGQCCATVNFSIPIAVGSCLGTTISLTEGLPPGSCFPLGTTTNTYTVTAPNGQTASCSFSVIVSDITPPTINCPSDIYVESDPEQCSSIVTFSLPSGEDFCSIPIISQISGLESGSVYPVGQTINVFKAVDQSGNIATCSFTVTVVTPEGLFIECPDDITVNLAPGICTAEVNFSITPSPDCFTSKSLIQYNNPLISNAGALGCYFAYTSFWRVFNLNEFGINTGYLLKSVTTAVVNASEDEFTLRIYLLNGSFAPGNLTLIGEKSMSLSGNGIYIEIPLDSPILIPAGSTFVVELAAMPVPPFGPSGQNQLGESAPTYFSSAGCGINNPIPISSLGFSFIGLFHPNGTVMDNVSIINQSEINPFTNQPYNSGDEYPPGITPMSFLVSSDAGSSSICSFSIGVIPGTGCQTINIVESVIPPWQRENDPFEGYVTVETVNPSNASWHLEIDVIDLLAGGVLSTIEYPSITSNTQYFFSADPQLNAASTEGRQMRYYAVLDQVDLRIEVAKRTNIIEKKWNYKNVVVFNDEVTTEIKIPIRYDPNVPGSSTSVEIYRFGNVSLDLELSELSLKKPNNLVDNLGSPSFPVGSDGYVTIKAWNSNLESLWPGDFYIDVKSDQGEVLEKMYFDLTKIGQVFSNSTLNNKAIIVIGGLYNDIEGNVKVLDENKNNPGIKDFSYSLLLELFNEGFDIWYIAQGNANSIKRNGHDIGLATYSIIDQNPQIEELNFLCHSKGGLDLRAFLSGMTESFDGSSPVSFESSPTFSIIEKVLFLGTPHNGALDFYKTLKNFYKYGNSPGAKEALKEDNTLDELNDLELPNTIYYANLSGYRSKKKLKNFNPFSSNESVFDKNSFYPSDGVVSTLSSFNFTSKYFFENSVKQLFQNSNELLPPSHFDLHKTSYLETTNYLYQEVNCLPSPLSTNLKKIIDFFNEDQIDLNTPFTSCPHPNTLNIVFNVIGSWIPGAVISIRPQNDTVFYFLGFTNEEGSFSGSLIPSPQIGDSIRIEATGYETISLVVDSNYLEKRKFGVSMIESSVATLKVKDPSLSFKNGAPFLSSNFCIMEAKGENVLNFEVNQPFNQDTIFVPLQLQNDQFSAQLDTGYNQILVRFIGSLDTVTLSKEVFFLPDTLFAAFTNYVTIISDSVSLGAKLYSNNQYLKEISSPLEVVPLFLGENHLQFIKFGYIDSILTVNSDTTINLSLQLIPHSYSSPFDGNIINFPLQGKLQYRRNVTMLDADQASIISLKQYDDDFPGMGLIPKSRKFEYRNLNAPIWSNIKTATILDQIEDLCPDSVYLLRVLDDAQYEKVLFDTTGNIAAYDSTVQKLTYNYVNFKQGLANKEAIAIMKKKAPKAKATPDYMVFQNESMTIPVSDLFVDPDSIKNDMTFQIQPGSPDGVSAIVSNGNIVITPNFCFFGKATLTIVATHDGLKANNTLNILVSSSAVTNCLNNATTSENGQFLETMEVTGTPGDNWTVMMVAGLFQEGSPAPPSLPVPIMIGTPLSEITSGIFQLQGKHIDALGYTVQLTNGMETVCFSNLAYYPNPSLTGLSSEYCTQDGPQTVTVTAQLGDGSGQATVENILFELIRLSDNSVVGSQSGTNDTFQFDPSTLQNGSHKLRVTFDALLDGPAHPGCMQSIEEGFLVKKVGCGEFPWDGN